jgi:hypothetical protein
MSDDPPEISILDARLAEIDRRLRSIQTDLAPGGPEAGGGDSPLGPAVIELPPRVQVPEPEPPPEAQGPPPHSVAPVEEPELVAEPAPSQPQGAGPAPYSFAGGSAVASGGSEASELARLGADLQRIIAAQESLLATLRDVVSAYDAAVAELDRAAAPAMREFSVSAGPFTSTEALHRFEQTLAQIAEVSEVEVRGYEGDDRAIVDVHLFDAKP